MKFILNLIAVMCIIGGLVTAFETSGGTGGIIILIGIICAALAGGTKEKDND